MSTLQEITAGNAQFNRCFELGDPGTLANLYTEDAQVFPAHSEPLGGRSAIRDFWAGVMQMGIKGAALETVQLEEHGDTAIEVGKYRLVLGNGAEADHGKYVVIWKRMGGQWKLHRDIWNTNVAAVQNKAA